MLTNIRGVGKVLTCVLLLGCVSGKKSPPRLPHDSEDDDPRGELTNEECQSSTADSAPPFDQPVAEGVLKHAMDRAWSCGLHTLSHFDLTINMSWGNAGCVAQVALENELPSNIAQCLVRRFGDASLKPFNGGSPSVQVRMTNDRAWWTWL